MYIEKVKLLDIAERNLMVGNETEVFAEKSSLESFLTDTCSYLDGDKIVECEVVTTDVSMVFNQNRLRSAGAAVTQEVLDRFRSSGNGAYDSFSDEDIIKVIKPRFLQAPCEIRSWMQYLVDNHVDLVSEIQKQHEISQRQKDELENGVLNPGVEPSKSE